MKALLDFLKDGGWILVITVVVGILFVVGYRKARRATKKELEYDRLYASIKNDIIFYESDKRMEIEFKLSILEKLSINPGLKEKTSVLIGQFDTRVRQYEEDEPLRKKIDKLGWKMVADQSIEEIIAMPDKKKASQMLIDRSENKRGFQNRSDQSEEDLHFMSHIQ